MMRCFRPARAIPAAVGRRSASISLYPVACDLAASGQWERAFALLGAMRAAEEDTLRVAERDALLAAAREQRRAAAAVSAKDAALAIARAEQGAAASKAALAVALVEKDAAAAAAASASALTHALWQKDDAEQAAAQQIDALERANERLRMHLSDATGRLSARVVLDVALRMVETHVRRRLAQRPASCPAPAALDYFVQPLVTVRGIERALAEEDVREWVKANVGCARAAVECIDRCVRATPPGQPSLVGLCAALSDGPHSVSLPVEDLQKMLRHAEGLPGPRSALRH